MEIYRRKFAAISIHALREEGDKSGAWEWYPHVISIHALREEGDHKGIISTCGYRHFNPRPP